MSTRRKHIEEAAYQLSIEVQEGEKIARVIKVSSNLVEVELEGGKQDIEACLVLLPKKFNKRFWLKVGSFVLIELDSAKHDPMNRKIKGSITRILYQDQIRELKKKEGVWPKQFNTTEDKAAAIKSLTLNDPVKAEREDSESSDSEDGLPPLMPNPNRSKCVVQYSDDDSDSY